MPTFSNHVSIAGELYELGGDIRVINFRDNPDYSFAEPIGGQCDPTLGGGVPGFNPAVTRRYSYRAGLPQRTLESLDHAGILDVLGSVVNQAIIHHDGTYHAHQCFNVLCSRGLSTHFMVNHDGGIIQGLDPMLCAHHAGTHNSSSVGIDMNNIATVDGHQQVYPDPAFGGVVDYTTREVVRGPCNHSIQTSFAYTEAQYVSLARLLELFHDLWGFPLIYPQDGAGEVVRTRLAEPQRFVGFMGHWHCQAGKWDPGPGFDWVRVMELLHGKANHWPVDLGVGALPSLRSQQAVEEASTALFRNIEEGPAGGCYPVGLNQQWHDGVHVYAEAGTPVVACADGEIVLTRNGPGLPLGSPNFVLVRHRIERERVERDTQGVARLTTDEIFWYSLYMHLQRQDPGEVPLAAAALPPSETARAVPDWYARLVQLARESKGDELEPEADYEFAQAQSNPRQFEERARGLLRTQEYQHAYQCIEQGNPFRWLGEPDNPEDRGLPVEAGALLGYVGEFGEPAGGGVRLEPLLHFQIFSTVPIFDDTRFEREGTWRRLQADLTGSSLVSVPEVILPIVRSTRHEGAEAELTGDVGSGRVLTPAEVDRFFKSGPAEERAAFRTFVAQHHSEWDIATDAAPTADVSVLWPWQVEAEFLFWRALHVGYRWLNDDTRDLVGMAEGPAPIFTYHPIYLLAWWALNYGRAIQGETFDGMDGAALRAELEREQEQAAEDGCDAEHPEACERHVGEDPLVAGVTEAQMREFDLQYPNLEGLESGEWPYGVEFLHPLDQR